jgi:hypothetical protein
VIRLTFFDNLEHLSMYSRTYIYKLNGGFFALYIARPGVI